jgi:hypothetical protein
LEETEHLHLKTAESAAEITIDPEVLSELEGFEAKKKSPFIVESIVVFKRGKKQIVHVRKPRPQAKGRYYRCEPVFMELYKWLVEKNVKSNKPLHELRKEIGALIATEHGIFAASTFLRHSDITTTARHYADHKTRITVGLGKYLNNEPQIVSTKLKKSKACATRANTSRSSQQDLEKRNSPET